MEEGRSAFKILKGKPIGKRPLGRPRRRWEDNIRSILILSSHLRQGLLKGLFPVGLPVKILKGLLPSSILATCPANVKAASLNKYHTTDGTSAGLKVQMI